MGTARLRRYRPALLKPAHILDGKTRHGIKGQRIGDPFVVAAIDVAHDLEGVRRRRFGHRAHEVDVGITDACVAVVVVDREVIVGNREGPGLAAQGVALKRGAARKARGRDAEVLVERLVPWRDGETAGAGLGLFDHARADIAGPFGSVGGPRTRRQRDAIAGRPVRAHARQVGIGIVGHGVGAGQVGAGDIDGRPRGRIGGAVGIAIHAGRRPIGVHVAGIVVILGESGIFRLIPRYLPGRTRGIGDPLVGAAHARSGRPSLGLGLVHGHGGRRGRRRRGGSGHAGINRGRERRLRLDQIVGRGDVDLSLCAGRGEQHHPGKRKSSKARRAHLNDPC